MKNVIKIVLALGLLAFVFWRPFSARWELELIPLPEWLEVRVRLTNENSNRLVGKISGDWRHIGSPVRVVLKNGSTQVPGGEIVFSDTTLLPGGFQIQFGDKLLIVQQNRVELTEVKAG